MNHGDGGLGPGGGGGRETKGKFHVVAKGQHVRAGWAGAEPGALIHQQTRADAPCHGVSVRCQQACLLQILAGRTKGAGQRPGNWFRHFLKFAGGIDQERRYAASGVFSGRGQQFLEILGAKDSIVVDDQEISQVRKFFEGMMPGGGEAAPEAEVFAGRNHFAREGGIFTGLCGGGVGAIVANHHGVRWKGLAVEGVEQAGEEIGAEAGGDQGDNFRRGRHRFRMYGLR